MERMDVRGLSCPIPVVRVTKRMKKVRSGVIEVLCEIGAQTDNITRLAHERGWEISEIREDDDILLVITKK